MVKFIMIYVTKSPKETEKLAGFFVKKYIKNDRIKAIVIALEGELGAGKTVFVKGVARALKINTKIKSPTFNLMKHYKLSYGILYHLDCYRLKDYRDLKILGIKEILKDSKNIILIEWSDRVKEILPKNHIKIHIDHIDKTTRKLIIK